MDPLHNHPIFTDRYFENLIRVDRSNSTVRVCSVQSRPAVAQGENFASQLLRVAVSYKTGGDNVANQSPLSIVNFIVKAELQGSDFKDMIDDCGHFAKEIACYRTLLPAAHLLLRSIGDETLLAPK